MIAAERMSVARRFLCVPAPVLRAAAVRGTIADDTPGQRDSGPMATAASYRAHHAFVAEFCGCSGKIPLGKRGGDDWSLVGLRYA